MTRTLAFLALVGCSSDRVHDQFNVRSGDAVLPVGVYGDLGRGTLIVYESGGPSGPGVAERMVGLIDFRDTLEEDVAIAFYDRRGTGNAQGTYHPDELDIDVLVDDLHVVTRVLQERYEPETMILMGHSFGAVSAPLYLRDHPGSYDAWAAVAPAWTNDQAMENEYRRLFAIRVATQQIEQGDTSPLWTRTLEFCEAHPVIVPDTDEQLEFWDLINAIDDRVGVDEGMEVLGLLGTVFGSHYNLVDTQLRENLISDPVWASLSGVNMLDELEPIAHPTLVVTGEYDEIGNTEIAVAGLERLATPDEDRELVEIPDGGHYPFVADPKGFAREVMDFVDHVEAR